MQKRTFIRYSYLMLQRNLICVKSNFSFFGIQRYNFSTLTTPIEYMKTLESRKYKTPEDLKQEIEDLNNKFETQENSDIDDISTVTDYMLKTLEQMKVMRNPPISQYISALNYCIEKSGNLNAFDEHWKLLERLTFNNMSFLSPENSVNLIYYFCKFRKTNNVFWNRFDSKIINDVNSLTKW